MSLETYIRATQLPAAAASARRPDEPVSREAGRLASGGGGVLKPKGETPFKASTQAARSEKFYENASRVALDPSKVSAVSIVNDGSSPSVKVDLGAQQSDRKALGVTIEAAMFPGPARSGVLSTPCQIPAIVTTTTTVSSGGSTYVSADPGKFVDCILEIEWRFASEIILESDIAFSVSQFGGIYRGMSTTSISANKDGTQVTLGANTEFVYPVQSSVYYKSSAASSVQHSSLLTLTLASAYGTTTIANTLQSQVVDQIAEAVKGESERLYFAMLCATVCEIRLVANGSARIALNATPFSGGSPASNHINLNSYAVEPGQVLLSSKPPDAANYREEGFIYSFDLKTYPGIVFKP